VKPLMVTSETEMQRALKERREELGLTGEALDEIVGLSRGHVTKIENADKPWGKRAFQMTPSMDWLLEALGMALVLVPRVEARGLTDRVHAPEPVAARYAPRSGESPETQQLIRSVIRIRRSAA